MKNFSSLVEEAKEILAGNWKLNHTLPSPKIYPFQWNWDTAFIAIGYANYDIPKACEEYRSLFKGQWKNGFLPHIIFWDEKKNNSYFPGSSYYNYSSSPNAPKSFGTSAITQPPIHAYALEYMYQVSKKDERVAQLIRDLFIPIFNYHAYLYKNRDPENEGLVYINHPWESGTDNSPLWDDILESMKPMVPDYDIGALRKDIQHVDSEQRPGNYEYQCYLYLIDLFKSYNYDDRLIFHNTPFAVQDPLFNALLIRSNEALIDLSLQFGFDDKTDEIREWNKKSTERLNSKLYNPKTGAYAYFDLKQGGFIEKIGLSCLVPLITKSPGIKHVQTMIELLNSPEFMGKYDNYYHYPSYDTIAADFNPMKYWRGPVWVNMNWLLIQGLRRHAFDDMADNLVAHTISLISRNGFFEYFDPKKDDGENKYGYGSDNFSWTASLLIDIYHNCLK